MDETCFYITPIAEEGSELRAHADMMLEYVVEPAARANRLVIVRADKIEKSGMITKQIMEYLVEARLCVADLSFGTANAFYELGIRDALCRPAIQIMRASEKLPFDIAQGRTISIDTSNVYTISDRLDAARRELGAHIASALGEPDASAKNTPVSIYLPEIRVKVVRRHARRRPDARS